MELTLTWMTSKDIRLHKSRPAQMAAHGSVYAGQSVLLGEYVEQSLLRMEMAIEIRKIEAPLPGEVHARGATRCCHLGLAASKEIDTSRFLGLTIAPDFFG